jgi:hypothetical protein
LGTIGEESMNRLIAAAVVTILSVASSTALGAPSGDEALVEQGVRSFAAAWEAGDKATLETLLAPGHVHINARGVSQSRAELIALSGTNPPRAVEIGEVKVQVVGNVAVATGTQRFTQEAQPVVFTQVWVKDSGTWRRTHFQATVVRN